jgi:hypothetical protein
MINAIKDLIKNCFWDFVNLVLVFLFVILSYQFLKEGKVEEVKVLIPIFIVSLVFLNLKRFDVIRTPFLSGELKKSTAEALEAKTELESTILKSKNEIKKIKKELTDTKNLSIIGL